jgi:aminopeptidase N
MEEVSGLDLTPFFIQWLYKPGSLKLDGEWVYDIRKKEIILSINQIQKGEVIIEMPIEIGIHSKGSKEIQKIQLKGKTSTYKIKVDQKPDEIVLDPNFWVLMNSNFKVAQKKR